MAPTLAVSRTCTPALRQRSSAAAREPLPGLPPAAIASLPGMVASIHSGLDPSALARLKAYQQSFSKNWQEQTREQKRELETLQRALQVQEQALEQAFKAMPEANQP